MLNDAPAIQFLLNSTDPSIRYFTLVDLLDKSGRSRDVRAARDQILDGPRVKALLAGQHPVDVLFHRRGRSGGGRLRNPQTGLLNCYILLAECR